MKTNKCRFFLIWLIVLLSITSCASGEAYSFPKAGVRIELQEDWLLVMRDTLDINAGELVSRGIDMKLLRSDMEANSAVFVVLIDQIRVMLSRYENEQTAAWASAHAMTAEDQKTLLDAMNTPPYVNAEWIQGEDSKPAHVLYDWAFQLDGKTNWFSGAATVMEGALYQLTATGDATIAELREANEQVLSAMTIYAAPVLEEPAKVAEPFIPIEDDGVVTPLAMIDFTGFSYDDVTELAIQTLPGAEVVVITANDKLRAIANEEGIRTFRVSTRREMTYEYTIQVSAPDRKASQAQAIVERQLSPELKLEAYKKSAHSLDDTLYDQLLLSPGAYTNTAVMIKGRVAGFSELDGYPCAFVYTKMVDDSWVDPICVMLIEPFGLLEDSLYTVYGDIIDKTIGFANDDGIETEVPVIVARSIL